MAAATSVRRTALSLLLAAVLAIFSAVYFRVTRSWSQN